MPTEPEDPEIRFSPRRDPLSTRRYDEYCFDEASGKTLYQTNAEAILEVINTAVLEDRLPRRVQGRLWELCRNLGYLSCDCSRACTGKFQTVLEEFGSFSSLGLSPSPLASAGGAFGSSDNNASPTMGGASPRQLNLQPGRGGNGNSSSSGNGDAALLERAVSVPTQVMTHTERSRRKSLSQADVLRKQKQALARYKKGSGRSLARTSSGMIVGTTSSNRGGGGARSPGSGGAGGLQRGRSISAPSHSMRPPSSMPLRMESDTSETDDGWDVGEEVQELMDSDAMLAVIDEPCSPNVPGNNSGNVSSGSGSPSKHARLSATTVRVKVEMEKLQASDESYALAQAKLNGDSGGGGGGGGNASSSSSSPSSQLQSQSQSPSRRRSSAAKGTLSVACKCFGLVSEATGPLKYMEDRHICLNADPFTVYKLGVGSEELAAVEKDPDKENSVYEALYGVVDGHGGELVAECLFIDFPRLLVQHPLFNKDIKQAILATCAEVDRRYVQQSYASLDQSGAVATFVLIRNNRMWCASVGDCRAVLSTSEGFAIALTHDHTLANSSERARVERTDAKISRERIFGDLVVTRSFGDARHKPLTCKQVTGEPEFADAACDYIVAVPEITTRLIQPSDEFVIIASDGLWDVFPSQSAVDYVRRQFTSAQRTDKTIRTEDVALATKKLIKEAQRRGSRDNCTVTIVCLWAMAIDPNMLSDSDSESDSDDVDEVVEY